MKEESKRQQVIDLVRGQPVIRPRDLKEHGLPKDYLYSLAQEGVIERIGRGLYQWPNKDLGRHHSLVEISKLAPKAVVALLSALNYHNMTTQTLIRFGWPLIVRRGDLKYPIPRSICNDVC